MDPTTTCWTCRTPLDPAARTNPDGPDWDWHPTCAPTTVCPCITPWDEPNRCVIQLGRGTKTQLTGNPRASADHWLRLNDATRVEDWEPTASGWRAHVTGSAKATATITLPRNTAGYHCVNCHTNWASFAVAQHHQHDWSRPCRRPSDVRDVMTGRPLLVERDTIWYENPPNALAL